MNEKWHAGQQGTVLKQSFCPLTLLSNSKVQLRFQLKTHIHTYIGMIYKYRNINLIHIHPYIHCI